MNELLSDTKSIVIAIVAALMSLLTWVGRRQVKRIDDIEQRMGAYVSREELSNTLTQMREDRKAMHEQNREDLQYIRERVDSIADRKQ